MDFVIENSDNDDSIRCPCIKCKNLAFYPFKIVREHLFFKGFDESYTIWTWHGETKPGMTKIDIGDQVDPQNMYLNQGDAVNVINNAYKHFDDDPKAFKSLLEDVKKPLYSSSQKYTKLGALVKLYNLKGKYGWSNTSFSDLLSLLIDMLPENDTLPRCTYEAKKSMFALGLQYEKIHACPNDCVLYRKEYENLSECPTCEVSQWQKKDGSKEKYRKWFP